MRNKGFTLIELIIVIVICIIIGVTMISIFKKSSDSKFTITNGQMKVETQDNYDKSYEDQMNKQDDKNYEAIVYVDGKEVKRYDVKRYTKTNEGYTLYLRNEDKKVQVPASTIIEEK